MQYCKLAALTALALTSSFGHALAASPAPTSWEIAGQFDRPSPCNISPIVWRYGKKASLAAPFVQMDKTYNDVSQAIRGCRTSTAIVFPLVSGHTETIPKTYLPYNVTYQARALMLHPGPSGELAVARFTAPASAQYRISGRFYGIDGNGSKTTTTVTVRSVTGASIVTSLFSDTIDLPTGKDAASFTSKTVMLQAGEHLDFEVGMGADYFYDQTGLHGVIEAIGPWCGGDPTTC